MADLPSIGLPNHIRDMPAAKGSYGSILLKKSAMVSTVEKYAPEIEIFTLSRGVRGQISRSGAQKRRFQRSVCGESGRTDFFNTIGRNRSLRSHCFCPRAATLEVLLAYRRKAVSTEARVRLKQQPHLWLASVSIQ